MGGTFRCALAFGPTTPTWRLAPGSASSSAPATHHRTSQHHFVGHNNLPPHVSHFAGVHFPFKKRALSRPLAHMFPPYDRMQHTYLGHCALALPGAPCVHSRRQMPPRGRSDSSSESVSATVVATVVAIWSSSHSSDCSRDSTLSLLSSCCSIC